MRTTSNGWRLVGRVDRAKRFEDLRFALAGFDTVERCQRCGRQLRYVDLLRNSARERLAVGRQCSRRLRE
jgi:hypothetical protein